MPKLNQIIAIEKGVKSRVYGRLTELHKLLQKPALFNGFSKQYEKRDEEGEDLPPERQRVQMTVSNVLMDIATQTTELLDVTASKDWTNTRAFGRVMDGDRVLFEAPVTYLLFLEKQLSDLRTMIGELPVLDEAEEWSGDSNSGLSRTAELRTHRTKKVQKPIVLYQATPEHPAQTQLVTEDIIAGYWKLTKLSGAMAKPERDRLLGRVETLFKAVKQAREEANGVDVIEPPAIGNIMFDYLMKQA